MSSTSTSAAMPLLKFWVSNFSIRFFLSCTGTFVHFFFFSFLSPFESQIPSTQHTTQYNTIFNILLFFITLLFFLTWQILLLIFNYFFLFILNHTCLLSPRFLHFILLNFITFSFTLLHLRFAFLLVRNFCVFYQNQCGSASSQVLSFKFLNTIFFLAV